MPFPNSTDEFWSQVLARGMFPLSISRGSKSPIGSGWNAWTSPIRYPNSNAIGLRCGDGGLSGFDCDVGDPDTAGRLLAAFKSVMGDRIPVRWGRKPRFLVPFFLVDEPVKGRTYSFPNGDKLQLMGGQFVAFGPHKDTNQPYEWENWDAEWPRLTTAQLQSVLAEVPARAGTSLRFSADHETASVGELEEAAPRTQDEWQAGRDASLKYLGTLTNELRGKTEGRGSTIFSLVGVLKFAELNGIVTRGEIEKAIEDAGHHLDEGLGGRTLREEIERHNHLPVLRGNLIMQAIVSRRQMLQGIEDARNLPVKVQRSGFEISLEDDNAELPWIIHQRFLASEVHFLTGHSGAGKSTVATDAAISFLTGRNWLDADIERPDGHVLWVAAEDDYGTERRVRHLLRQEPNGQDLANRFHLIRGVMDPAAFDLQCCGQVQAMAAMGKRVDIIVLDTWGASGLCFADNDTEAVLKEALRMFPHAVGFVAFSPLD